MPVFTIYGATGLQGKAVATSIAEKFGSAATIRAVTRDPSSERSQTLRKTLGAHGAKVELVQSDIKSSPDHAQALVGTEFLFLNTNSFELFEAETQIAKDIIDAAAQLPSLRLLVWSTLPPASKLSNGKLTGIKHFDQKARVDEYLISLGDKIPWVGAQLGWFAENVRDYHLLSEQADGSVTFKYAIATEETAVAWTWIERELGPAVLGLFEAALSSAGLPQELKNTSIPVGGWRVTFGELVQEYSRQSGRKFNYERISGWGNQDLDQMNEFFVEFGLYPEWEIPAPPLKKLGIPTKTLQEFVADSLAHHKFK
ncbi:hypothetical protein V8E36_008905 [Tilletia maclaganii]